MFKKELLVIALVFMTAFEPNVLTAQAVQQPARYQYLHMDSNISKEIPLSSRGLVLHSITINTIGGKSAGTDNVVRIYDGGKTQRNMIGQINTTMMPQTFLFDVQTQSVLIISMEGGFPADITVSYTSL